MIKSLVAKIKLRLNPPKDGDVYLGDPFDFIFGSSIEHILHGMKSRLGDPEWMPIPSLGCYRLTIESCAMPYYRCTSEALCLKVGEDVKEWRKRSQPRRISKKVFHDMILEGRLVKV